MKKVIRVCDICEDKYPDAKIKYKYRAKQAYTDFYGKSWHRIELCEDCLRKITNSYNINNEMWNELKETILEMRDNGGAGTQKEVCTFLLNLMGVLEKQNDG